MKRVQVLPRDLKPGDKIDRVNRQMDIVQATVKEVLKIRRSGRTAYKVYMTEYDALPGNRRPWPENKHLTPFTLQPTARIWVDREES